MPRPGFADVKWLESKNLCYVPFLGPEILEYSDKVFSTWPAAATDGFDLYEDRFEIGSHLTAEQRFCDRKRLQFRTSEDLRNAGFIGRAFIFLDQNEFIYVDYLEASGICLRSDKVTDFLGHGLHLHFLELRQSVSEIGDFQERRYYQRLIENSELG